MYVLEAIQHINAALMNYAAAKFSVAAYIEEIAKYICSQKNESQR